MKPQLVVVLALVAACGGDGATGPGDVSDTLGDDVRTDTVQDADAADTAPGDTSTDDTSDTRPDATPSGGFEVRAPHRAPADAAVPIVVHAVTADGAIDAAVSGRVALAGAGGLELDADGVVLRRGVGSVTTGWNGTAGTFAIDGVDTAVAITPIDVEPTVVSGTIDADTTWSTDAVIRVSATTTVAGSATLTVESGVWVSIADGANLLVDGSLDVRGAEEAPVVFAPAATAWGGIVLGASGGSFRHAFLVGGGADTGRAFGHSFSQPIVFSTGGDVSFEQCVIQDAPGKAMGARGGAWTIDRTLVTRTDTGGEFEEVAVTITDSHYMDFPELDPTPRDDDNDAIYLLGDPADRSPPRSTITRTTFVRGADDGIDHNGSTVDVVESWIEGFDNECIAASSGGAITVSDTALVGCGQGLEAGYGSPTVVGRHLLVTACGVGLRFGDNYTREYTGTLTVEDSVVFANTEHAVWNWVFTTEAPAAGRITVSRSVLDTNEADGEGGSGNVVGTPTLTDDLLLAPGSAGAGIAEGGGDPGLQTGRPR